MSFNATNPSAGRLYEKPYVKLHHTDINLSSLCALMTIKIYKSSQTASWKTVQHIVEKVYCVIFNVLFNRPITQKLFK